MTQLSLLFFRIPISLLVVVVSMSCMYGISSMRVDASSRFRPYMVAERMICVIRRHLCAEAECGSSHVRDGIEGLDLWTRVTMARVHSRLLTLSFVIHVHMECLVYMAVAVSSFACGRESIFGVYGGGVHGGHFSLHVLGSISRAAVEHKYSSVGVHA